MASLSWEPSTSILKNSTTISGNITYDYQYRSLIDPSFYNKDFQQHTISVNMKVLYNGNYPMNVRFQIRKSNQPLFRDLADFNLQFNYQEVAMSIRQKIVSQLQNRIRSLQLQLPNLQQEYKKLLNEINQIHNQLNDPALLQKIIEKRERDLLDTVDFPNERVVNAKLKIRKDSSIETVSKTNIPDTNINATYNQTKERYAKLQIDIARMEDSIAKITQLCRDSLKKIESSINGLNSAALQQVIKKYNIKEDSLMKGYKTLLAIRQLSVGRSMINYSELTAKNISITGVNVEYNPSWYASAAIGFTDWQFRGLWTVQKKLPAQYLALGRIGWGDRDKNSIIFTYFTGKRNLLAPYATGNNELVSFTISGASVEGIYHLGQNHQLTAEIAKSSYPKYIGKDNSKLLSENWLNTSDHQNEAYSISYKGMLPTVGTNIQGSYRRMEKYYQSYAFYNSPSQQEAWNLQLDQSVKWINLRVGLQKNQYNLSMLPAKLENNIVFKTFQATIQYKKWPTIMAGYYPSSQITLINDEIPVENRFYTLNFSANHSYKAFQTYMNSSLVYTQFYNTSTDTSFIYYNAQNLVFTQIIWVGKWSLQGNYTAILQNRRLLNVWEAATSCKVSETFAFNGGLKWNSLVNAAKVVGYSAGCTVMIKHVGAMQVLVDKSYWPGQQYNLLPNTNGRLTLVKTF